MRKVIIGSLNGNAYQFEEGAFRAIKAYLDAAAAGAAGNADRRELLTDLEQAIADKCDTYLGKHRNVISDEEARQILSEMGAVEFAGADSGTRPSCAGPGAATGAAPHSRRLYRIPAEGMMGGVCAGLADYFAVDVVWVRLTYLVLAFCTGVWFFVWLAQLIITPKAITDEELAVAQGTHAAYGR